LFYDCEQIYYAPSTIKKIICGSGRADKKQVQNKILETYPKLEFKSDDESDAVSIGLCFFIERRRHNAKKDV
jgi:crossover junction endodeoxyribonuclease RuvC